MAETKRTFEQDDLFNRKPYAKFLERLILSSGSYHRDDDVQAYTIAIDSPWGTGKSVFLEKFENMLKEDCPDRIRVVHYSAWKNDFWDNAFEPFADAIFTSEWFCSALEDDTNEQAMKNFFGAAKNVMLSFVKKQTEDHFDAELLEKAIEDFATGLNVASSKNASFVSKSYLDYVASLKQMQKAMDEVLLKTLPGGKLVIIIDELDRCRPTFAVETLEVVKHIMDVKDIVFIFSLDIRQLGATIKQVYGVDTDATGYLMRFFSYYSRLPEATTDSMISKLIEKTNGIKGKTLVKNDLIKSVSKFELNPRDIETIGKVYKLMVDTFLSAYNNRQAYLLYWILLCSKYKEPYNFVKLEKGGKEIAPTGSILSPGSYRKLCVKSALKMLNRSVPLQECEFSTLSIDSAREEGEREVYAVEKIDRKNKIKIEWKVDQFSTVVDTDFREDMSLSGFLFTRDLLRWDEIKDLTPAQFLLQQMEMFNFIPEIPSATE